MHGELELLVRAGLSPAEALASATSVPARSFGLGDRGRVARGLRADLILVDGDPTAEIRKTAADRRRVAIGGPLRRRGADRDAGQRTH